MDYTATGTIGIATHITRVGQGDRASWARLVEARGAWVLAIARSIVGAAEAEDACHEVFLRLHAQAGGFQPGRDPDAHGEAWMRRLAVNCCLNWRRQRLRRQGRESHAAVLEPASDAPTHDRGQGAESNQALLDALAALAPADRTAITMRFWDGCSHEEVARAIGGSALTARVRLSRAVARLRKLLGTVRLGVAERLAEDLARCGVQLAASAGDASAALPHALHLRVQAVPDQRIGASALSIAAAFAAVAGLASIASLAAAIALSPMSLAHHSRARSPQAALPAAVQVQARAPSAQESVHGAAWPAPATSPGQTDATAAHLASSASASASASDPRALAITRRDGPAIALIRAMSTAARLAGAPVQTTTTASVVVSWDATDAGPVDGACTHRTWAPGTPDAVKAHAWYAMPTLPAQVKHALAPVLAVIDVWSPDDGARAPSYICLCSCQDGSRCMAVLMPTTPLAQWFGPDAESNAATACWKAGNQQDGMPHAADITFLIPPSVRSPAAHG